MFDTTQSSWVYYIPIVTTLLAIGFSTSLFRRYCTQGRNLHLLWWGIGIAFYGLGTLLESLITLLGNSIFLNKAWYIAGAMLGGYPLAQGSLFLLYSKRFARMATAISLPVVVIGSLLVALSPVFPELIESHRPSGSVLAWKWVRLITPFVNFYAVFFLIGGAAVSSWRYFKKQDFLNRAWGNAMIAFGAILPGIGGSMAKAGMVEALYVGEFVGLIFIWLGDRICSSRPKAPASAG